MVLLILVLSIPAGAQVKTSVSTPPGSSAAILWTGSQMMSNPTYGGGSLSNPSDYINKHGDWLSSIPSRGSGGVSTYDTSSPFTSPFSEKPKVISFKEYDCIQNENYIALISKYSDGTKKLTQVSGDYCGDPKTKEKGYFPPGSTFSKERLENGNILSVVKASCTASANVDFSNPIPCANGCGKYEKIVVDINGNKYSLSKESPNRINSYLSYVIYDSANNKHTFYENRGDNKGKIDDFNNGVQAEITYVARCIEVPSCSDGVKNGAETGIDCGGSCKACASCSNGVKDDWRSLSLAMLKDVTKGEEGIDCGGVCSSEGKSCPSCFDNIKNQDETGIDCGGVCKEKYGLVCATCFDGIQNQKEAGIDCGGPCEKECTTTSTRLVSNKIETEKFTDIQTFNAKIKQTDASVDINTLSKILCEPDPKKRISLILEAVLKGNAKFESTQELEKFAFSYVTQVQTQVIQNVVTYSTGTSSREEVVSTEERKRREGSVKTGETYLGSVSKIMDRASLPGVYDALKKASGDKKSSMSFVRAGEKSENTLGVCEYPIGSCYNKDGKTTDRDSVEECFLRGGDFSEDRYTKTTVCCENPNGDTQKKEIEGNPYEVATIIGCSGQGEYNKLKNIGPCKPDEEDTLALGEVFDLPQVFVSEDEDSILKDPKDVDWETIVFKEKDKPIDNPIEEIEDVARVKVIEKYRENIPEIESVKKLVDALTLVKYYEEIENNKENTTMIKSSSVEELAEEVKDELLTGEGIKFGSYYDDQQNKGQSIPGEGSAGDSGEDNGVTTGEEDIPPMTESELNEIIIEILSEEISSAVETVEELPELDYCTTHPESCSEVADECDNDLGCLTILPPNEKVPCRNGITVSDVPVSECVKERGEIVPDTELYLTLRLAESSSADKELFLTLAPVKRSDGSYALIDGDEVNPVNKYVSKPIKNSPILGLGFKSGLGMVG